MSNLLTSFPTRTFDRLNQMMEELTFPELVAPTWSLQSWNPNVDISETEKEYTIKMDLPGFEGKDINVEVKNDILHISGKREQIHDEKKDGKLIRHERRYGSFTRAFSLDAPVEEGKIEARFFNGVLTVTAPKTVQAPATRVPVKS
ncbi:MAG TPA: Hsp20/alpha crystallin family protein [Fimbriimonas sp.]|nr:Hsp20/alpha crystallin family protein [Fimbriimonas sp.]